MFLNYRIISSERNSFFYILTSVIKINSNWVTSNKFINIYKIIKPNRSYFHRTRLDEISVF